ncbi:MAG TPA: hypothetical protein VG795_05865 [Acidimicrobiia bacterium]|nr:hypothetical protein [Acidimicrobiia bacterium]
MRRAFGSVVLAVVIVLGLGLGGARPAGAAVQPSELSAADVVVEPGASLSAADRERFEQAARQLRDRGASTKFVILANRPESPPRFAGELRQAAAFNGNVLVLVPSTRSLGIASPLPPTVRDDVFNRSLPELRADPVGGTIVVAERLADAATSASLPPSALPPGAGQGAPGEGESSGESSGGGGPGSGLVLVGLLLVGVVGFVALGRRAARRRAEADLADRRAALEPMIDALAAHITDLGSDLRLGGDRVAEAQPYYDEAVLAYGEVRDAMPTAQTAPALHALGQTLERGLRAAVSARAVLDGRPIPPPEETALLEGLCAFDPKHGRAVREMPVVTPTGNEAQVPVCSTCAEGLEEGQMPDVRRVYQHGAAVPYWQGAGAFGFGGPSLFPMFGGFLGGMVLHDLFTPDVTPVDHGGSGGDWGGGDWGGGDGGWGGGDFGGGDFGGDIGGGGDF